MGKNNIVKARRKCYFYVIEHKTALNTCTGNCLLDSVLNRATKVIRQFISLFTLYIWNCSLTHSDSNNCTNDKSPHGYLQIRHIYELTL